MLKILLIDDAAEKIAQYKGVLENFNEINLDFVDTASCLAEAERLVSQHQYDLAVLDLFIPIRYGDEPNPENALLFFEKLQNQDGLKMPHNLVAITRHTEADSKYKYHFDNNLLAYIIYKDNNDDWKEKLSNKISFLLKAQYSVKIQDYYDYDVAIVNALESENKELRRVFDLAEWKEEYYPSDRSTTFYTTKINVGGKNVRIVTCYALQMASTASSALTTKLIYYYRPRYVIMTGIAAGVNRKEVNLGDIMVASMVWDGASGKIKTDEVGNNIFYPDYHQLPLHTEIQSIVQKLQSNRKLLNKIEEGYPFNAGKPNTRLQLHLGPIASVPAVLSSNEEVDKIQAHCRKLLGVEMEGYGVFYAANNSSTPRPIYTILIKSVSDYADPKKSDDFQQYAMYTSAAFAKYLILNELDYNKRY